MEHQNRFTQRDGEHADQVHAANTDAQHAGQSGVTTLEDAVRRDRDHTEVPESVRDRLAASIAGETARRPWWKRWLGR